MASATGCADPETRLWSSNEMEIGFSPIIKELLRLSEVAKEWINKNGPKDINMYPLESTIAHRLKGLVKMLMNTKTNGKIWEEIADGISLVIEKCEASGLTGCAASLRFALLDIGNHLILTSVRVKVKTSWLLLKNSQYIEDKSKMQEVNGSPNLSQTQIMGHTNMSQWIGSRISRRGKPSTRSRLGYRGIRVDPINIKREKASSEEEADVDFVASRKAKTTHEQYNEESD